ENPRRNNSAGEFGGCSPTANSKRHQQDENCSRQQIALNRMLGRVQIVAHRILPPSAAIFSGTGADLRKTLLRTSSLSPKALAVPSAITSTWSTPSSDLGRCVTTITIPPRRRTFRIA